MRYLTREEEDDFFKKYLALHGLEGNRNDYDQLFKWFYQDGGIYPNILQKKHPLPVGKLYGYLPKDCSNMLNTITMLLDYNNYTKAIESYKTQIVLQGSAQKK